MMDCLGPGVAGRDCNFSFWEAWLVNSWLFIYRFSMCLKMGNVVQPKMATLIGENYDQTSNILIHMGDSLFFHKKQATHGYPKIGLCSFSHTLGLITVYLTL